MKIFVTGGTGFIGQHLVKSLVKLGHEVMILTRNAAKAGDLKFVIGKLANIDEWLEQLISFDPEVVYHLAWEGIPDYGATNSANNLTGSLKLFEALARTTCKRVVSTGSCWEYGVFDGELKEDAPVNPVNAFIASKHAINHLGKELLAESNIDLMWARVFFVYGPGQRSGSLIPYICSQFEQGNIPELKTPFCCNDYIYIDDCVDALVKMSDRSIKADLFNICSGEKTAAQMVLQAVGQAFNKHIELAQIPSDYQGKTDAYWGNNNKAKETLNWGPSTTLADGILKMVSSRK